MAKPQPFDPGYDYEADNDIVLRLSMHKVRSFDDYHALTVEAAAEIRALRLHIKNLERRIDGLVQELSLKFSAGETA